MASAETSCYSEMFTYIADVSNLATTCIESPEFELSDVNWHIKLCKKQTADCTDVLAVHLISSVDEKTEKWSCEAKAMFKLLPKNDQKNKSIVKYLVKEKFGHNNLSHGLDEFIIWKDFLEHYVSSNEAIFEVAVSANPLNRIVPPNLNRTHSKFRIKVEQVSALQICYSSEVIVRSIKWKLSVQGVGDYLAVYLYGDKNMDKHWSYEVDATFRLLSFNEDICDITKSRKRVFSYLEPAWGYGDFLSWSKFTDGKNRYVVKDTANFELEFTVDEPKPLWEIDEYHMKTGDSSLQCSICLELFSTGQIYTTKCGHLFCQPCIEESIESNEFCPMCKAPTKSTELHPIYFT